MQNKIRHITGLILGIIFLMGCSGDSKNKMENDAGSVEYTFADSLWIGFRESMINNQIDYLNKNSFDTIQCIDCLPDSLKSSNELYDSRFIFNNHLAQLMHLDNLDAYDFSTYQNDTMIYVIYSIKWKYAEEGVYGLHYIFKRADNKYLFQSMFTTP